MSKELVTMLNGALARELAVSIQYMWHHVMGKGMESPAARELFKEISIVEMKHAESIASRIDYLGGDPTTQPKPIKFGGTLEKMVRDDLESEREGIAFYKMIITKAEQEGDAITRALFEDITAVEEEHEAEFAALLGEQTGIEVEAEAA